MFPWCGYDVSVCRHVAYDVRSSRTLIRSGEVVEASSNEPAPACARKYALQAHRKVQGTDPRRRSPHGAPFGSRVSRRRSWSDDDALVDRRLPDRSAHRGCRSTRLCRGPRYHVMHDAALTSGAPTVENSGRFSEHSRHPEATTAIGQIVRIGSHPWAGVRLVRCAPDGAGPQYLDVRPWGIARRPDSVGLVVGTLVLGIMPGPALELAQQAGAFIR